MCLMRETSLLLISSKRLLSSEVLTFAFHRLPSPPLLSSTAHPQEVGLGLVLQLLLICLLQ